MTPFRSSVNRRLQLDSGAELGSDLLQTQLNSEDFFRSGSKNYGSLDHLRLSSRIWSFLMRSSKIQVFFTGAQSWCRLPSFLDWVTPPWGSNRTHVVFNSDLDLPIVGSDLDSVVLASDLDYVLVSDLVVLFSDLVVLGLASVLDNVAVASYLECFDLVSKLFH